MSKRHYPWSVLGIDPTGERRVIKRAYTKLLKAIDVENDPKAFMDLRAAHDSALQQMVWHKQQDKNTETEVKKKPEPDGKKDKGATKSGQRKNAKAKSNDKADIDAELDALPASDTERQADPRTSDGETPDRDDPSKNRQAAEELDRQAAALDSDPQDPRKQSDDAAPLPNEEEDDKDLEQLEALKREIEAAILIGSKETMRSEEQLASLIGKVLNSTANENVDTASMTEIWAAELINDGGQAANPIIAKVHAHYGWTERDFYTGNDRLNEARNRAYDHAGFLRTINGENKQREAMAPLLQTPPDEPRWRATLKGLISGKNTIRVLTDMRQNYPSVEHHELNREAVNFWDWMSDVYKPMRRLIFAAPVVILLPIPLLWTVNLDSLIEKQSIILCWIAVSIIGLLFYFYDKFLAEPDEREIILDDGKYRWPAKDKYRYFGLPLFVLFSVIVPGNIYTFVLISSAALLLRFYFSHKPHPAEVESFTLLWMYRIVPVMGLMLLVHATLYLQFSYTHLNLIAASLVLIWVMIRHRPRMQYLMQYVTYPKHRTWCIMLIIGAILWLPGWLGYLLLLSSIYGPLTAGAGLDIRASVPIAFLLILLYFTAMLDVWPEIKDRFIWYFGFFAAVIMLLVFAPIFSIFVIIMRMRDTLRELRLSNL